MNGVKTDVTIVTPHIPIRPNALARAIKSAALQTVKPAAFSIVTDVHREGSAITRNIALAAAQTTWVAFLDDDDVLDPHHLETLLNGARDSGADVVYSGCRVIDGRGNRVPIREEWGRFNLPFDAQLLRETSWLPVTSLVRTGLAKQALFGPPATHPTSPYDDWGFYVRLLDNGAWFHHVPEVTWTWYHHGRNTSGDPRKWS